LIRQIELIGPEVIVALGKFAAQTLLRTKTPITQLRGRWFDYHGIRLMPTFHPAYLLRNPADKRLGWQGIRQVIERLGTPGGKAGGEGGTRGGGGASAAWAGGRAPPAGALGVAAPEPHLARIVIDGGINPAVAQYVERSIARAASEGAVALVIELDTPGGLLE